jgi:superfamily I DNA/RNA helicase
MDTIDFDDQLLMTFAYGVAVPQFDWVFVDESQDLSPLQHILVSRALRTGGHVVAVGDECQAIYGFRGADSDSMQKLQEYFHCKKLPLHVSYRCPQNVVKFAQRYVPHIQAHHTAPEGTVVESNKDHRSVDFAAGDMVVCRFNAPLVKAAYALLRRRIPCTILGREIGQGLLSTIKKLRATDMPTLLDRLATWESKEASRFILLDKEEKAAAVHDKADTIRIFAEGIDTIPELELAINRMFSDAATGSVVTLATIHKCKGLEAERVFIVNFSDMPCRWAKKAWAIKQELNMLYVALTRSKSYLEMIVVPKDE